MGSLTIAEPASPYADVAQPGEARIPDARRVTRRPRFRGRVGAGAARPGRRPTTAGDRAVVMSTQPDMVDARRIYDRNDFVPAPERDWEPMPGVELTVLVREFV